MIMRVLLLNPPAAKGVRMVREGRCMQREGAWTSTWAPISLATIAAVLKKEGFTVKLNDCIVESIDFSSLKKIILSFRPDLVILNTATPSIISDLSVSDLVQKINPSIKTAAFGIHVSALSEDSLKMNKNLDFVIRGEPEETAKQLIQRLRQNKSLANLPGISYRQGKKIIHNQDRFIANLDSLPFPAWEEVKIENYRMPLSGKPFLLVGTGRGCPYNCLFCADKAYYGQRLRLRSPQKVVDEIEYDFKRFKVREFLFWAESFTLDRKFALEVCQEIIKRRLSIRFVVNSRVDHVDRELLYLLKKAGCFMIGFGIESGSDRVLRLINKKVTVSQIKKAVNLSKKAGLSVTGHFMLGYPGETKSEILKTIKLACMLPFDFAQFYCVVAFPGSDLYDLALKNKWIINKNWEFFEQNFSVLDSVNLNANKVMSLRRFAYRKFYLRPKIIFKTLSQIRNLQSFSFFLRSVFNFGGWVSV